MKVKEDIRPISYVKTNTADVLKQVNKTHRPMYITQNGEAKAVVLDSSTYENMKDALALMKLINQSEENIKNGETIPQETVFSNIRSKFKELSSNE